jgi:hypothetical protein
MDMKKSSRGIPGVPVKVGSPLYRILELVAERIALELRGPAPGKAAHIQTKSEGRVPPDLGPRR